MFESTTGDRAFVGTEGVYLLPHQASEIQRLRLQHQMLLSSTNGLLLTTPRQRKTRVLDCGAADGHWLLELPRLYPDCEWSLHGVDIAAALFPPKVGVYASLDLQSFDIRSPPPPHLAWEGSFDLVHQRLLFWGLLKDDWSSVLKSHFSLLRPGGYIQLAEIQWPFIDGPADAIKCPAVSKIAQVVRWCDSTFRVDNHIAGRLEALLEEAGFKDVTKTQFTVGMGASAKDDHMKGHSAESLRLAFRSLGVKLQAIGGGIEGVAKDAEEYFEWVDKFYVEVLEHGFCPKLVYVVGQRPE